MERTADLPVEEAGAVASQVAPDREASRGMALRGVAVALAMGVILLAGTYFRVVGHDWVGEADRGFLSTRLAHWVTWDENRHLHPDERFLTMVENAISTPQSIGEYFDTAHSSLNPNNRNFGFFVYGTLPIFLVRVIGEAVNMVDYDGVTVLGRLLSALFDLAAVVLLFVLARRLYDVRVALLAAALSALAVMQIQQSHFFTVDTFANFFIVLTFYFAVRVADGGRMADYLALGLSLGAAVASKISIWSFGAIAALAAVVAVSRVWPSGLGSGRTAGDEISGAPDEVPGTPDEAPPAMPAPGQQRGAGEGMRAVRWAVLGLAAAAVLSVLAFRIFQPYAFQGPGFFGLKLNPTWLNNMNEVQRLVNGEMDYPPGHQWTDRIPYWFPWINMVVWGLGIPLGLAAWAGWLVAILRSVRSRVGGWGLLLGYAAILLFGTWATPVFGGRAAYLTLALTGVWALAWLRWAGGEWRQHILPVTWIALTFAYQGGQFVKSLRYFLQIYPFMALMAAWLLVWLWDRARERARTRSISRAAVGTRQRGGWDFLGTPLAAALVVVVVGGSVAWAWAFTRIYTRPVTRIDATRWVYANVPAGATIQYKNAKGQPRRQQVGIPNGYAWNENGQPNVTSFELQESGQITGVSMNYLADPEQRSTPATFEASISSDSIPENAVTKGRAEAVLGTSPDPRGLRLDIPLNPVPAEAHRRYYLITRPVAGAPIKSSGSILANEHWDDAIPMPMDGYDAFGMYRGIDLENYAEDEPSKLDKMVQWLSDTDFVMLTSNRLYGSIPRLPMRYPMTTRYYELLFSEQLGFKRVATFESYPTLGPISFADQETVADALHAAGVRDTSDLVGESASGWFPRAEEAFSVYDHPRVIIFQKTERLSPDEIRNRLSRGIEWDTIRRLWPRDATNETWKARWQKIPVLGGILASFVGKSESGGPPPAQASNVAVNEQLLLADSQRRIQQAGGTWTAMFDAQSIVNTNPIAGLVVWLLAVEVLGLLAFPVAFVVFRNLDDRGYSFAKTLGLLLVSYGAWLAGSLHWLPYTRTTLVFFALVLASFSMFVTYGQRLALAAFLRARGRLMLLVDVVFLVFFLAFLGVRLGYPDLWHPAMGGEKPMDFAYLNAVMKSTYFPPYDPWFAGGYLNYYYYGFVFVGSLIKLVAVEPQIAYNFSIPLLFALTALGAFGVVYNLTKSRVDNTGSNPERRRFSLGTGSPVFFGLLGALFVAVAGNLGEIALILNGLSQASGLEFRSTIPGLEAAVKSFVGLSKVLFGGQSLQFRIEWWYWNPTRIMPNGEIEEFPYFTFLYADLHAHMIALPMTLMALGLAVNLVRRVGRGAIGILSEGVGPVAVIASWGVYALTLGLLWPTNTWDYPTYLVVMLGALLIREYQQRGRLDLVVLREAAWRFGLLIVLSFLLILPYTQNYRTAYSSAELWNGARTSLSDYLTVHGFFLFVVITFLVIRLWDWWEAESTIAVRGEAAGQSRAVASLPALVSSLMMVAGLSILALALAALGQAIAAVVVLLGGLALMLILRRSLSISPRAWSGRGEAEEPFILFLIGSALALTMAVEYVVLKGDIGRMNTVFKFYLQVWVMLGVASAAGLAWVLPRLRNIDLDLRRPWSLVFGVLLACCLLYPVFATPARLEDRFVRLPPTVDGMAYMGQAVYHDQNQEFELHFERDAINWMRENVAGSPVVLEGNVPEYRWGDRFSIYTGLPTVVGWSWHQRQQRSIYTEPIVENRINEVTQAYSSPDPQPALDVIAKYGVKYVVVGELEHAYYPARGLAKFDQMVGRSLELVYQNPQVKIYRVKL